MPVDLPRGGGVPAQRGAGPPGRDAARADRRAEGAGLRQRARSARTTCCRSASSSRSASRIGIGARRLAGAAVTGALRASSSTSRAYRFRMPPRVVLARAATVIAAAAAARARWARCARAVALRAGRGDAAAAPPGATGRRCSSGSASGACSRRRCGWSCATWSAARCARCSRRVGIAVGGGDHHLGHVLARRARLHDRRPVRGRAAGATREIALVEPLGAAAATSSRGCRA